MLLVYCVYCHYTYFGLIYGVPVLKQVNQRSFHSLLARPAYRATIPADMRWETAYTHLTGGYQNTGLTQKHRQPFTHHTQSLKLPADLSFRLGGSWSSLPGKKLHREITPASLHV